MTSVAMLQDFVADFLSGLYNEQFVFESYSHCNKVVQTVSVSKIMRAKIGSMIDNQQYAGDAWRPTSRPAADVRMKVVYTFLEGYQAIAFEERQCSFQVYSSNVHEYEYFTYSHPNFVDDFIECLGRFYLDNIHREAELQKAIKPNRNTWKLRIL